MHTFVDYRRFVAVRLQLRTSGDSGFNLSGARVVEARLELDGQWLYWTR